MDIYKALKFIFISFVKWPTFAGGVDADDLFASVDERLLNLIEFSAKKERKKIKNMKKS